MKELIKKIIIILESLEDISIDLYQQKIRKGYTDFANLIPKLTNLVTEIFTLKSTVPSIEFNEAEFIEKLSMALNALEQKDTVLLADILLYEISPNLEILTESMSKLNGGTNEYIH